MSDTAIIFCSGYCEHGKFMGECLVCALREMEEEADELAAAKAEREERG